MKLKNKETYLMCTIILLLTIYLILYMKVQKNKKSMFVLYYAPWCGHCQRAKPDFEKLMKKKYKNLKIRAVDCDAPRNEVEVKKMSIAGFPTYYYFPDGTVSKGSSIKYNGGRSMKDMHQYLTQQGH